jgi:hypothetical protein
MGYTHRRLVRGLSPVLTAVLSRPENPYKNDAERRLATQSRISMIHESGAAAT